MEPLELDDTELLARREVPPLAAFEAAARDGRVRVRRHEGLALFCYTRRTLFGEAPWDAVARAARGVVFDEREERLVALPFPKFFNLGEREETLPGALPDAPFRVTEKLDGSLVIVFHDGEAWRTATKGSLTSPQSAWAGAWVERTLGWRAFAGLEDLTLLFEALYPQGTFEDDLVVDYGDREDLVLLTAYHTAARAELTHAARDRVADRLGLARPSAVEADSLAEVRAASEGLGPGEEGFVVEFGGDGRRVKVKGEAYLRAAKVLRGEPMLALWASLRPDGTVDPALIEVVGDAHRDDLAARARLLEALYADLRAEVETLAERARALEGGRERALWVQEVSGPLAAAVFARLNGRGERVHRVLAQHIRPDGGSLDEGLRARARAAAGGA